MTNRTWVAAFAFLAAGLQILDFVFVLVNTDRGVPPVTPAAVRALLTRQHPYLIAGIALDAAAIVALVGFLWLFWRTLYAGEEAKEHRWSFESILAASLFLALSVAGDVVQFMLAQVPSSDAVLHALRGLQLVIAVASDFPLAILLFVFAADLHRVPGTPYWLVRLAVVSGLFLLIGDLSVFATSGVVFEILYSCNLSGTMAFVTWIAAVGVAELMRGREPTPK